MQRFIPKWNESTVAYYGRDSRVAEIPIRLNGCTREAYEALGFEDLGPVPVSRWETTYYRRVRLPEGWRWEKRNFDGILIYDARGIRVVFTDDNHKDYDRQAWTRVIDVGQEAAAKLYSGNATPDSVQFALLTDEEVEAMIEELERLVGEVRWYPDAAKLARHWLGFFAEYYWRPA